MELLETLWQLFVVVFNLVVELLRLGLQWWLVIAWLAWWTLAVNWRRAWQWLAAGAWVPLVLLMVVAALVWSRLDSRPLNLGITSITTFWWQLGAVTVLVVVTLLCGWVQGLINWNAPEIDLEPPAHAEHAHHH